MIRELIDSYLAKEQADRANQERSGKWSPSMFGRCYRAQYWNRANEPQSNPPEERNLRVFAVGKIFHTWVQGFIKGGEIEKRIETDDVLGFADIVLENEVIDIKSQHSYAFHYQKENNYNIVEDKKSHVLQVAWYAIQLNKEYIRLAYFSKDDLCINEYYIKLTDEIRIMVREELLHLNSFWLSGTLPPAEPRAYGLDKKTGCSNECSRYCNFRDTCKAKEEAGGRQWNISRI